MDAAKIAWGISIIIWLFFMVLWFYSYKNHWYEGTLIFTMLQFVMLTPIWLFLGIMNHWW